MLVSVLARKCARMISYEQSLFGKIHAVGTLANPISVIHVAVSVLARMCTSTVSYGPSLLGIVLNKSDLWQKSGHEPVAGNNV